MTRFAPAPTGDLHLGHLVNALYTWGIARATGGRVVLRVEDHDRQRCRPAYETGLLDDLERLGLVPDEPPIAALRAGPSSFRQSDCGAVYAAAARRLDDAGLVYACRCSRATFDAWAAAHGRPWRGPGCPGACRRAGPGRSVGSAEADGEAATLRVALGDGPEAWDDLLAGSQTGEPSAGGDVPIRDRNGNWTYAFCVVVDDLRHGITLVVRGRDLLDATPAQLRLGRLLGREAPPAFLHHPLVRTPSGRKLSKADGATSVRSMLEGGRTPAQLFGLAARLAGLRDDDRPIEPTALGSLFA